MSELLDLHQKQPDPSQVDMLDHWSPLEPAREVLRTLQYHGYPRTRLRLDGVHELTSYKSNWTVCFHGTHLTPRA
jgi:hypothetical protein